MMFYLIIVHVHQLSSDTSIFHKNVGVMAMSYNEHDSNRTDCDVIDCTRRVCIASICVQYYLYMIKHRVDELFAIDLLDK